MQLAGWPIVLVLTNHAKTLIARGAASALRLPGGDAQLFYAAAYLRLERGRTVERRSRIVTRLIATRIKPVLRAEQPAVDIPVVIDLEDSGRIFFDWDHATAHLLSQPLICDRLREVVDVSATGRSILASDRRFTCKQLGLVAVSPAELAAAVQSDPVLMDELRNVFGVVQEDLLDATPALFRVPANLRSVGSFAGNRLEGGNGNHGRRVPGHTSPRVDPFTVRCVESEGRAAENVGSLDEGNACRKGLPCREQSTAPIPSETT